MSYTIEEAQNVVEQYGGSTDGQLVICSEKANENYGNLLEVEQEDGNIYLYMNSGLTMDYDSYAFRMLISSEEQLRRILDIVVQK